MDSQLLMYKYRLAMGKRDRRNSGKDPIVMVKSVFSRWCAFQYKKISDSARWDFALSARAAFSVFSSSIAVTEVGLVCDEETINRYLDCMKKHIKN